MSVAISIAYVLVLIGFFFAAFYILGKWMNGNVATRRMGEVQGITNKTFWKSRITIDLLTYDNTKKRAKVSVYISNPLGYRGTFTDITKEDVKKLIAYLQSAVDVM